MEDKKFNNVHVNPNFTNKPHINRNFAFANGALHINPNFRGADVFSTLSKENLILSHYLTPSVDNQVQPKIHVNPKLINVSQPPQVQTTLPQTSNHSKYVLHSKNKIIKTPATPSYNQPTNNDNLVPHLIKKSPSIKIPTKKPSYSLVRKTNIPVKNEIVTLDLKLNNTSKYLNYNKTSSRSLKSNQTHNKVWRKKSNIFLKNKFKLQNTPQKQKSILSPNKYKVNNTRSSQFSFSSTPNTINKTSLKRSTLHYSSPEFVYIRGEKYSVNNKVLKKVTQKSSANSCILDSSNNVKKISVSGVTYIRKSSNMFVIDNRNQNSIKKRRKFNITCPIFRRLGICKLSINGKCPLVHNPKNISICPKFLKGICKIDDCHLSHEVVLEKMPTCKFFLEGCCVRDPCPYLHVKVNEDADICLPFLQGYCVEADKCKNLHMHVCPEFYKHSKCKKSNCPYPHKKIEWKEPSMPSNIKISKFVSVVNKNQQSSSSTGVLSEPKSLRYFQENTESKSLESNPNISEVGDQKIEAVAYKGRPKLGILPTYISLE